MKTRAGGSPTDHWVPMKAPARRGGKPGRTRRCGSAIAEAPGLARVQHDEGARPRRRPSDRTVVDRRRGERSLDVPAALDASLEEQPRLGDRVAVGPAPCPAKCRRSKAPWVEMSLWTGSVAAPRRLPRMVLEELGPRAVPRAAGIAVGVVGDHVASPVGRMRSRPAASHSRRANGRGPSVRGSASPSAVGGPAGADGQAPGDERFGRQDLDAVAAVVDPQDLLQGLGDQLVEQLAPNSRSSLGELDDVTLRAQPSVLDPLVQAAHVLLRVAGDRPRI